MKRRIEDETQYKRISEEVWGEASPTGRPDILAWANRNVYEPLEREVLRRYPEAYGTGYQLQPDTGGNRRRTSETGRTRNQVQAGEQHYRNLGGGHMKPNIKKFYERLGVEVAPDDHPIWSTGPIITSMRNFMNPLSQITQKPTGEKMEKLKHQKNTLPR